MLNNDLKTSVIRKFKVIIDEGEKKKKVINIGDDDDDTLKSYGFTKFNMSGAFNDCPNLGYLIGASIDSVIYRAKPFTSMVYEYEMRKKQV